MSEDTIFNNNISKLAACCCDKDDEDKLELYKLFPSGYRIFCTECCAIADGSTVEEAVNNFFTGNFHVSPLTT